MSVVGLAFQALRSVFMSAKTDDLFKSLNNTIGQDKHNPTQIVKKLNETVRMFASRCKVELKAFNILPQNMFQDMKLFVCL